MTVALIAAALLGASDPSPTRLCQSDLPDVGRGRVAWFNLHVDEQLRRLSSDVFFRDRGLDARWEVGSRGLRGPGVMMTFEYSLALPRDTAFPVDVIVLRDGVDAARISLTGFPEAMVHQGADAEPRYLIDLAKHGAPNLFGAKSVELRALDRTGGRVADAMVPLPDWTWLKREADGASRAAEKKRLAGECHPNAFS